jgi:galactokinase
MQMTKARQVSAPGRVNLIGEHIDYHGLPVLPIAINRRVRVTFDPRADSRISAASEGYGARAFEWTPQLVPAARGDWENYLRAAAQAVTGKWGVGHGIDAEIHSDLPPAAGLSSSSALIVAVTLALLNANGRDASFEELMEVLPEGEHFVGTRGGGMDHAASLASRAGHASLISFRPPGVRHIPIPPDWAFLAAHSMVRAEKSGAVREAYNARRAAGNELHVQSEAQRVERAVRALEQNDPATFGRLLVESHESLRDRLRVSCPELDRLVETALAAGAIGARLTGAGFGGCAVIFCMRGNREALRASLIERYYSEHAEFQEAEHLINADAADGSLMATQAAG